MDRRSFLRTASITGSCLAIGSDKLFGELSSFQSASVGVVKTTPFGSSGVMIPDEGWTMWPDLKAEWKNDAIYLPDEVKLDKLPVNPPTGGWGALRSQPGTTVTLPATVEQFHWGITGFRPYQEEYKFETTDTQVKNGAYYGVSWWWRELEIPPNFQGKRILLHIRSARQRAEVYLNEKLVGYSIMEELPFTCDLTAAAKPGKNLLAIRITNPGGRLDWVDGGRLTWGAFEMQKSHGFGGLDRALMLSAHGPARVSDCWALNTPTEKKIVAHAEIENNLKSENEGKVRFLVLDPKTGKTLAKEEVPTKVSAGSTVQVSVPITVPTAKLWDLETPNVYSLRAIWIPKDPGAPTDQRDTDFGFRWFTVDGLGKDAIFRLNGRRIRLYTSISWGFWAMNGLFPTPELAEKEVVVAKKFNLNTLNFHRNLGKEDVLYVQDRMGLMRCLEPGGGSQIASLPNQKKTNDTAQRYMEAKVLGMIRAFRSHPSVIHYILQNEGRLDPSNPALDRAFQLMHKEDPSRAIVGNDGFVLRSPQVWKEAYSEELHKSGEHATPEGGAAGWWVDHTGHFSDVWQDTYYNSPKDFYYYSPVQKEIVEWGEMKGAAAIDNHVTLIDQIRKHGGRSYDLLDHQEILASYDTFLDKWKFRTAFPSTSKLFYSIGRRAYESWGQFMENVRICEESDMAAISGWESTAMENHSGIVDNFRDFKSDPKVIADSLLPVRPVAKQRQIVLKPGDRAIFDIYLLNDANRSVSGELTFTLTDPSGKEKTMKHWPAPAYQKDKLSYLVEESFTTEALQAPGSWRSRLKLSSAPDATHEVELLVVAQAPGQMKPLKIALAGVPEKLAKQIRAVPQATVEVFQPGTKYDVIVASGGTAEAAKNLAVDAEGAYKPGTGPLIEEHLDEPVLAAVKAGTPLLALTPTDGQSIGVAKQLASLGAFEFKGMVGASRASWMGSWYFVREHRLYEGLPVNQAMSIHYQVKGGGSNGWIIEGPDVEIAAAYSRDHDRNIGAGTFASRAGATKVVMHRILDMHPVFAQRFLANALLYLVS